MKQIDVATLRTWQQQGDVVVIDVRDISAFREAQIPGAINIPLDALSADGLPAHAGKKIVVHCGGGTRGPKAYSKLVAQDDALDVQVLHGGMRAWREQN